MAYKVNKQIVKALKQIDRPGWFCAAGKMSAVLPGLEVDKLGIIGLPLTLAQAQALMKRCEQAPYGKGEKTLVDTDVRRVWHLSPEHFTIANPAWRQCLNETLKEIEKKLGLEKQHLEAHLYDLLLYEKGSFFLPHRDSEKLDNMVATLVVMLPSDYEGGQLIVRHEGKEQVIDFAKEAQFSSHFACFYADCEHEVKPLTRGHRLGLVYNLTLSKSKKIIHAPRQSEPVAALTKILQNWSSNDEDPCKLAVLLDHQYTQDGLNWNKLKGVDRARADSLALAARQAHCKAYLAQLTWWETGQAEYDGYISQRGRGYYDDDDGDYEMGEIFDYSLTADHWSDPSGQQIEFGEVTIEEQEIAPEGVLTNAQPEEEFEGYTGNAGMTLERWYHHAAVILWPEKRHFQVLCDAGMEAATAGLNKMILTWQKAGAKDSDRQKSDCIAFAKIILDRWPSQTYSYAHDYQSPNEGSLLSESLEKLGDTNLIKTYFSQTLVQDVSLRPGSVEIQMITTHGWQTFNTELIALFRATNATTIRRNAQFFEQLCHAGYDSPLSVPEQRAASTTCRAIGEIILEALMKIDEDETNRYRYDEKSHQILMIAQLASGLLIGQYEDLLGRLAKHLSGKLKRYDWVDIQVPALEKLKLLLKDTKFLKHNLALGNWIAACTNELKQRTDNKPQPPADYRRPAAVECDCPDCRELNRFLAADEYEHQFKMRQDRRSHLENKIRSHRCDLDRTTNRKPRPQVLICTKNSASYKRRLKEYQDNLKHLDNLEDL